jgi:hypothetical protein
MFLLLCYSFFQILQLLAGTLKVVPRLLPLRAIHVRSRAGQPPGGPAQDRRRHLQIAQQFAVRCGRRLRLRLPLRFQPQFGLLKNALAGLTGAIAPGGIQLAGLPRVARLLGEYRGHPLAVVQTHARYRDEKLHGHMRGDSTLTHLLLNAFRKQIDQSQAARDPTDAAIEAARQFVLAQVEVPLQFRQQPALFERRLLFGHAHGTVEHQRIGLADRPEHRLHGVAPQLLESRDAFIAVDHQITVGLIGGGHHHDGRLLAGCGERSQKLPVPVEVAHTEMLPAPFQLVKLQMHVTG